MFDGVTDIFQWKVSKHNACLQKSLQKINEKPFKDAGECQHIFMRRVFKFKWWHACLELTFAIGQKDVDQLFNTVAAVCLIKKKLFTHCGGGHCFLVLLEIQPVNPRMPMPSAYNIWNTQWPYTTHLSVFRRRVMFLHTGGRDAAGANRWPGTYLCIVCATHLNDYP